MLFSSEIKLTFVRNITLLYKYHIFFIRPIKLKAESNNFVFLFFGATFEQHSSQKATLEFFGATFEILSNILGKLRYF